MRESLAAGHGLRIDPPAPHQGQTVSVEVPQSAITARAQVEFNKHSYKLFPVNAPASDNSGAPTTVSPVFRSLFAIPADLPPGKYKLSVGDYLIELPVSPGNYGVQRIRLPKEKDNFIASPGEEQAVDKAKAAVSEEQLWSGHFVHPSKARISTRFGLRRMVNGRLLKDYFHSGLDFAGSLGTPVVAGQSGKVILAHRGWKLHGNTVAIDHGQGVVSFYIHLKDMNVKEGDSVKAGQIIAHVGQTGRATGPHLHFSIYVNGTAADPMQWFSESFN